VLTNFGSLLVLFPGANFSELHEEKFKQKGAGWFPETTHLLVQNEIPLQSTTYALHNAKGATVIMNPSPLPSPVEIRDFPWNLVDWLLVNEEEARELYKSVSEWRNESSSLDAATLTIRQLVLNLSAEPAFERTNIVCTLGPEGVLAFVPTFHRPKAGNEVPSFIQLSAAKLQGNVRDTTGAGDCFTGYFVKGLMEFGPGAVVGTDIKEDDIVRILKTCVQVSLSFLSFADLKVSRKVYLELLSFPYRLPECVLRKEARLTVYPRGRRWRSDCYRLVNERHTYLLLLFFLT